MFQSVLCEKDERKYARNLLLTTHDEENTLHQSLSFLKKKQGDTFLFLSCQFLLNLLNRLTSSVMLTPASTIGNEHLILIGFSFRKWAGYCYLTRLHDQFPFYLS